MGELIELIIRAIEALTGKKRDAAPDPNWQAQQAEWERQRREWEAAQQRMQQPAPVQQPMAPTARVSRGKVARPARVPPLVPASTLALIEGLVESAELVEVKPAPPARPVSRSKVTAGAIAQWARPKTLRSQFILTEILKPPLSIRGQVQA